MAEVKHIGQLMKESITKLKSTKYFNNSNNLYKFDNQLRWYSIYHCFYSKKGIYNLYINQTNQTLNINISSCLTAADAITMVRNIYFKYISNIKILTVNNVKQYVASNNGMLAAIHLNQHEHFQTYLLSNNLTGNLTIS